MESIDVAVVGAGAAGLMAAIFAGRGGARVVAFDGSPRIGAKILIAGGGRCNVTHHAVTPDDFNGSSRNQIAKVLRTFSVEQTMTFFRDLGVPLKREETGKLFPVTDRAQSVLDALIGATTEAGAEIRSGWRVSAVREEGGAFAVAGGNREVRARRVILATGGRSVPKTGSDGGGYALARALGHTVTDTFPALVPLLLPAGHWATALGGISVEVELAVTGSNGKTIRRERGPLLFAHFGVTGPVALDLSRHWIAARSVDGGAELSMNLVPGAGFAEVESMFRAEGAAPGVTLRSVLRSRFPDRLADAIVLSGAALDPETPLNRVTRDERRRLVHALTAMPLPITGDRGFAVAEVTAGGVPLDEVRLATMESRKVPGLYLCGEILDVDGRIGGFNFQWAWASGRLAGMSATA